MTVHSTIDLSRLRDIGWKLWDPIGIAPDNGPPDAAYVDEYDRYLIDVVSLLGSGSSIDDAKAYLIDIASEHNGYAARRRGSCRGDSHRNCGLSEISSSQSLERAVMPAVVAFSMKGDADTGDFDDPVILATFGDVPEMDA